jgi:hypothetical protein
VVLLRFKVQVDARTGAHRPRIRISPRGICRSASRSEG